MNLANGSINAEDFAETTQKIQPIITMNIILDRVRRL